MVTVSCPRWLTTPGRGLLTAVKRDVSMVRTMAYPSGLQWFSVSAMMNMRVVEWFG